MATTSVSSTTSTSTAAAQAAASSTSTTANSATSKAAAQKLISSLSAGSGVDVNALAQNLVDAEKAPLAQALNSKISKNQSRISGYSAISFVLNEVLTAITDLKDQNSYNSLAATVGDSNALSVTADTKAQAGSHDIEVLQVAQAQRRVSNGVASPTAVLNGGKAMSLTLTVNGVPKPAISLADGKDTPQDVVNAINAANQGVTAQLINTGDGTDKPYQIVLTGATGLAGAFSLSTNFGSGNGASNLVFDEANTANQKPQNAEVVIDGILVKRSTNTISDAVAGLTLQLRKPTTGSTSINLTRDTSAITAKFNTLVTNYNDAMSMFGVVTDPKSTVDTYGATLVGDSTARSVKQQLRGLFQGTSTTPGTSVSAFWQLGIKIDEKGVMSLDSTKLENALQTNFADVVKTMTGNLNGISIYNTQSSGFAGDAYKKLSKLIGPTGPMVTQTNNADTQNSKYQQDLAKLDTRMQALLARYTKQFAAMDSLVGSVNTQKSSLKSTFDGMMAAYTNKN